MKFRLLLVAWGISVGLPATTFAQMDDMDMGGMLMTSSMYAPVNVMGDHTMMDGKLMFTYRYMEMEMKGNRDGSSDRSTADVLGAMATGFLVAPLRMTTRMHMFGAMYAPTGDTTVGISSSYVKKRMTHITRMGVNFRTNTEGFGDTKVNVMHKFFQHGTSTVHANIGISIPTGSIREKGVTPRSAPSRTRLPYPMQIGSGTWDANIGATYRDHDGSLSWGAQGIWTERGLDGRNNNDYKLGDVLKVTTWVAHDFNASFSGSLSLEWKDWDNIDGADPGLSSVVTTGMGDRQLVPTAFTNLRGGERLNMGVGVNFKGNGQSLGVAFSAPIYQHLDGPQLEMDWMTTIGWRLMF